MNKTRILTLGIVLAVVSMFFASAALAYDKEVLWSNESPLTSIMAKYYNVEKIVVISIGQRMNYPGDVPVTLFIANQTGVDPIKILYARLASISWAKVMKDTAVPGSVLFTDVPNPRNVPSTFQHAYDEYSKYLHNHSYQMVLYDKEIRNLVQLKFVCDYFGTSPMGIMKEVEGGRDFIQIIMARI